MQSPLATYSNFSSMLVTKGPSGAGRPSGRGSTRQNASHEADPSWRAIGSSAKSRMLTDSLSASRCPVCSKTTRGSL